MSSFPFPGRLPQGSSSPAQPHSTVSARAQGTLPQLGLETCSAPGFMALNKSLNPQRADDPSALVSTGMGPGAGLPDVSPNVSLTSTVALILPCVKQL